MTKYIIAILAFLLIATTVSADMSVSIPDVTVIENEYISVPVYIMSESGTIGGEIIVSYDTSLFSVREVEMRDYTHSFMATWYTNSIGVYALANGEIMGDSTFVVIQFEAHGDPGDVSALDFNGVVLTDESGGVLEVDEYPGSITIMPEYEPLWGDVNCDGTVTSVDALLTMQHVHYGIDLCSEHLADVDHDGSVTMADAWLILDIACS